VLDALVALGDYGRETTLVVTTDHGRAAQFRGHGRGAPESAEAWLIAAGGAVPARGGAVPGPPRPLAAVGPSIRALLGVEHAGVAPLAVLLPPPDAAPPEPGDAAHVLACLPGGGPP
jgi:hypothetical protein